MHKPKPLSIHVLVPCAVDLANPFIDIRDEYAESAEMNACFSELGCTSVFWHHVYMNNIDSVVLEVAAFERAHPELEVVAFNLCDGTELDGRPGSSVIRSLERHGLAYTGADANFNDISTSKAVLKKYFIQAGVRTPVGVEFRTDSTAWTPATLASACTFPMILKPDQSYGAVGVHLVWNAEEALSKVRELQETYGTILGEEYVDGAEYTALVVDDVDVNANSNWATPLVYPVMSRNFDASLARHQRFFTPDVFWNKLFHTSVAPESEQQRLQQAVREAYAAVGGSGYGRVDMRVRDATGEIFILEANSLCGLSGQDDSSVGLILQHSGQTLTDLVDRLIRYAIHRRDVLRGGNNRKLGQLLSLRKSFSSSLCADVGSTDVLSMDMAGLGGQIVQLA